MKEEDKELAIINFIKSNPSGVTINDLCESLGYARNTVSRYLRGLEKAQQVIIREIGRNKLYTASERSFISKKIVQSFLKGILVTLKKRFPNFGPLLKEMGKELSQYLYGYIPKSVLELLREVKNTGDLNTKFEYFKEVYPYFDLFQDSYEITVQEIDVDNLRAIYRFSKSEFIEEDYIDYYYAMCGVLEEFCKERFDLPLECNVEKINISANREDSFIDISITLEGV